MGDRLADGKENRISRDPLETLGSDHAPLWECRFGRIIREGILKKIHLNLLYFEFWLCCQHSAEISTLIIGKYKGGLIGLNKIRVLFVDWLFRSNL